VGFPSIDIGVGYPFSHIALSCDDLTLAVCFERDGTCLLGFIDVCAFYSTVSKTLLFDATQFTSCMFKLPLALFYQVSQKKLETVWYHVT
jgi:hypothetical protein